MGKHQATRGGILSTNTHKGLLKCLETYLEVGGLPEVVLSYHKKTNWRAVREDILFRYFHDFKRAYGEAQQAYFIACLKTTAHLLGSPFKNSHVAVLLDGGKNQEIINSLSRLEAWKIIHKIDQMGPAAESHFHPKRYLFDIGIAKQLREAVTPTLSLTDTIDPSSRNLLGGIIENVMVNHLAREMPEVTGWKKAASGSEVDFVVKKDERLIPIECKAALSLKNSHLGGLRDFMRRYKLKIGIVVSLAPFETRTLSEEHKIINIPLYLAESWQDLLPSE